MAFLIFFNYLILVNLITYVAFHADKTRAIRGDWRISEFALLSLALCGGWPASKLAQRRFRHKTRKQPFAAMLNFIPIVWLAAVTIPLLFASLPGLVPSLIAADHVAPKERATPKYFQSVGRQKP